MPVEEHLTSGEEILASAGDYYATSKRVIRYRKRLIGEELDDLAYSHITSLSLVNNPRTGLITPGIILLVLGIIGIIVNIFADAGLVTPLSIIGLVLGIVLIVCGIIFPLTYVQFRAPGISGAAEERLRMTNVNSEDAQKFISVVREHMYH